MSGINLHFTKKISIYSSFLKLLLTEIYYLHMWLMNNTSLMNYLVHI